MDDRRSVQRTRISRNAEIVLSPRPAKVQCTLQDVTNAGARLSVTGTDQLPDTFELTFDQGRSHRFCRVKWRNGNMLGVAFEKTAE